MGDSPGQFQKYVFEFCYFNEIQLVVFSNDAAEDTRLADEQRAHPLQCDTVHVLLCEPAQGQLSHTAFELSVFHKEGERHVHTTEYSD